MISKVAYFGDYREMAPRHSRSMYTPPAGWRPVANVTPALGRVAKEILERATNEQWPIPSDLPFYFGDVPYIAKYQIHGPSESNPRNHPGIGLYEWVGRRRRTTHIGGKLDDDFFVNLKAMCNRLGCDPKDMLALMHLESGLDPNITRPHHAAMGLNQMMPIRLKGVGWGGTPQEYGQLSASQQLPYIERYFRSIMSSYHTGPLRSLPLLYLANFWPASLANPAVQEGNPSAIIVDSRKYPKEYKENSVLDVDKDGKITYGDIANITGSSKAQVARSDVYSRMENATGTPTDNRQESDSPGQESTSFVGNFLAKVEKMVDEFEGMMGGLVSSASHKGPNQFLISIDAGDLQSKLEYALVLKAALEEELGASVSTHTDGKRVDIQCSITANKEKALAAIKELCAVMSDTFKYATRKIGGIKTYTVILSDKNSCYQELDINIAEVNHRKFLLRFYKIGK